MKTRPNVFPMFIVALLSGIVATSAYSIFYRLVRNTPVIVRSVFVVKDKIHNGDPLLIKFNVDRTRLCKTEVDQFVLRYPEMLIAWRNSTISVPLKIGTDMNILSEIYLPELRPGPYLYRAFIHSDCGGGELFTVDQPDVEFEIIK